MNLESYSLNTSIFSGKAIVGFTIHNTSVKEMQCMAANSNQTLVPSAREALNKFKMESASEVGVTLKQGGYNGDITARQAGSIGGQMVKKMIQAYENGMK